jgi:multiple antibiotic resistance protein
VPQQAQTALVLLVVLFLNWVLLRLSDPILRVIGTQGAAILIRVMGILLAALAVEIVMKALSIGDWAKPMAHGA